MRRTGLSWVAVAAITFVLSGCSNKPPTSERPGAQPGAVGTGGAGANVKSDAALVRDVALKNLAVIELSRMALDKTANPDNKSFAQRMIDAHSADADKLTRVASGQPNDGPAVLDY